MDANEERLRDHDRLIARYGQLADAGHFITGFFLGALAVMAVATIILTVIG